MAVTEARIYGNKAWSLDRRRLQNEETEEEKTLYLNTKEISKNIIKTLRLTTKQRGFLLQNQQREQDSKQVGINTLIYQRLYSKQLIYQVLKIRKEISSLKILLRVDTFQPFTMTQKTSEAFWN